MTHKFSRRQFLTTAGVIGGGTLLARVLGLPQAFAFVPSPSRVSTSIKGRIHLVGLGNPLGNASRAPRSNSILTSIDIASGEVKSASLNMTEGHIAVPLPGARRVCMAHHGPISVVVDDNMDQIASLTAPEGYLFGGHAAYLPSKDILLAPVRKQMQSNYSDKGLFLVYDPQTLRLIDQVESAGIHPHEIRLIPGTKELAVTHYGDIFAQHSKYSHNVIDTKLTIYDVDTLKEVRSFSQNKYEAMLTHMSVTPEGKAYCVLTQYIDVADYDDSLTLDQNTARAKDEVTRSMGYVPDYPILEQGVREGRIAMPLPFLSIDTMTGETAEIYSNPNEQIRSQSVATNQQTGIAVATYFFSNTLVLHRTGSEPVILKGNQIGMTGIRGVTDIAGTPFIIVSGSENGSIIMDVESYEIIARFESKNHVAPHVEFEPA